MRAVFLAVALLASGAAHAQRIRLSATASGGAGGVCSLDGSTFAQATYYRASTTTGTGFQCDAQLASCIDLGPGAYNYIGTNVAGDIVLGPGSGSNAVVRIFGAQYVGNFVQATAGFDAYFNGALFNSFTGQPLKVSDAEGLAINGTTPIKGWVQAAVVVDFATIANNSCATQSVTVTGATVGDAAWGNADFALPLGVSVGNVRVTASNTVELTLCNNTSGGSLDPASGNFIFRLSR